MEESLALARELDDPWNLASSLLFAGELARCQEEYVGAMRLYEEGLALARKLGDMSRMAQFVSNMGFVARHQREERRAASLFVEGLHLSQQIEDDRGLCICFVGLAGVATRAGRPERAARLLGAAEGVRDSIGYSVELADRADYDAILIDAHTRLDEQALAAAWAEGRAMTLPEAIAYALEELLAS